MNTTIKWLINAPWHMVTAIVDGTPCEAYLLAYPPPVPRRLLVCGCIKRGTKLDVGLPAFGETWQLVAWRHYVVVGLGEVTEMVNDPA